MCKPETTTKPITSKVEVKPTTTTQQATSGESPPSPLTLASKLVTDKPKQSGQDDFYWSDSEEPHASRRKEILDKYPEIKKLYGHDPYLRYQVAFVMALQTFCAYWVKDSSWMTYIATAYIIGATSNHMLMMSLHELAHHLGFQKFGHNKLFSLFTNLPVGIPAAISFKRYHMDHHKYQGEHEVDVDIPTEWEGRWINTTLSKFFFVFFQGFFYALRPLLVNPKTPGRWEMANLALCLLFDGLVLHFMGPSSLGYLFLSTLFGTGLHPVAGHFIAEHYIFTQGNETYSYYGFFNIFTLNVGYHNEHHDFPFIPGRRLPQLKAIASEYYDSLPQHPCWIMVLYNFIMDPTVTAFSRVKRSSLKQEELMEFKKNQ